MGQLRPADIWAKLDGSGALAAADSGEEMPQLYSVVVRYVSEKRRLGEFARTTARTALYTLTAFADTVGPDISVGRVKRAHVEKWLLARDVAPGTVRRELSQVRTFFGWCIEHELLKRDPSLGLKGPRRVRTEPRSIDTPLVAKLLLEADERGQVALLLMFQEGLRRAEVTSLTTDSVDMDRHLLFVTGKGGHQRWLPLSEETERAVRVYLAVSPAGPGAPLIRSFQYPWKPITPDHLSRLVAEWMYAAGVKERPWDGKSAHSARHTMATDMIDHGADLRDVQEMLGHQHLSTTVDVYARRKASTDRLRAAASGRTYLG